MGIGTTVPLARLDANGGVMLGGFIESPAAADHILIRSDRDVAYEGGLLFANKGDLSKE